MNTDTKTITCPDCGCERFTERSEGVRYRESAGPLTLGTNGLSYDIASESFSSDERDTVFWCHDCDEMFSEAELVEHAKSKAAVAA